MREVEVEIIAGVLDFNSFMEELAGHLGLPLIDYSDGKTTDHFLDTRGRKLLASGASMRLREKWFKGRRTELRLTVKFPLEDHEILMVRDEVRMRLLETDWKNVVSFMQYIGIALAGDTLTTQLLVDEYYQQVSCGTHDCHLDVSYDHSAYISPTDPDRHKDEYVLEFEDHGVGSDVVVAAYEFASAKFGFKADRRGKYRRGIELIELAR
jgi:hypothetical protein